MGEAPRRRFAVEGGEVDEKREEQGLRRVDLRARVAATRLRGGEQGGDDQGQEEVEITHSVSLPEDRGARQRVSGLNSGRMRGGVVPPGMRPGG